MGGQAGYWARVAIVQDVLSENVNGIPDGGIRVDVAVDITSHFRVGWNYDL